MCSYATLSENSERLQTEQRGGSVLRGDVGPAIAGRMYWSVSVGALGRGEGHISRYTD